MLDMQIGWGKAKSFRLEVRDAADALVDLTNKTLRFSVKESRVTTAALITALTGDGIVHDANQNAAGKGLATLRLEPADTTGVAAIKSNTVQAYVCELELIQVVGEPEVIDSGFLTVSPAVRTTV